MMNPEMDPAEQARHFLENEQAFRLGVLPTENSNPKTRHFSRAAQADTTEGIRQLLAVDRDVADAAAGVFSAPLFTELTDDLAATLGRQGRVIFSGCGATGRLSILLEAMWRRFWQQVADEGWLDETVARDIEARVGSVMTGGDFALVKSVESFEDHAVFGAQQLAELNFSSNDLLVAVSEGGETPSVIGTLHEALRRGGRVYFAYNNPTAVLCRHVARSREAIRAPGVRVLELFSGEMAVAGSTRMQAVTFELLVLGAALEIAAMRLLEQIAPAAARTRPAALTPARYAATFDALVGALAAPGMPDGMAAWIEAEEDVYRRGGLVTYFGHAFLLDAFTDTTERSPTFMLPAFRKAGDMVSAPSWAFVKDLFLPTEKAWPFVYRRPPRCLEWQTADYERMGAQEKIIRRPPAISAGDLVDIRIGCEPDPSRCAGAHDLAVLVCFASETRGRDGGDYFAAFDAAARPFPRRRRLVIQDRGEAAGMTGDIVALPCPLPDAPLQLWHHLALKLILNTVSTVTMARLGRIEGNWMICVHPTNKKLIDRGTRLIAEVTGLSYEAACHALYESMQALARDPARAQTTSPVAHAIAASKARP